MTAQETNLANAFETTLTAEMGSTDTTATVATTTGGPTSPAYLVIEPNSDSQREYVLFDGTFTGTTFVTTTTDNRYLTGSAAGSGLTHPAGSVVRMVPVAQHFEDLNDRVDAKVAKAGDTMTGNLNLGENQIREATREWLGVAASTNVSPAAGDTHRLIRVASSTLKTITVETGFADGAQIEVFQDGAGQVQIVGDTGVTINRPVGTSPFTRDEDSRVVLTKRDSTETWFLNGDLEGTKPLTARKTADTSRSSTTTVTDDPDLAVGVRNDTEYLLSGVLLIHGHADGDFKVGLSVPTGCTFEIVWIGSGTSFNPEATSEVRFSSTNSATTRDFGTNEVVVTGLPMWGWIKTHPSVGGDVTIQWAQASSHATATVLNAGSWMALEQIT